MKAVFKKGFGDREMRRVRCRDRDQINAVIAFQLTLQHVLPAAIGTVAKAQALAVINAVFRAVIQRACTEFKQSIKPRTKPVRRSDLAAFAATDHAPFEFCHRGQLSSDGA